MDCPECVRLKAERELMRLIYTDAELRMKEVEMDSDTTKYMEFRAKAEEAALDLRLVETEII
jgi:hypothetical protein